MVTSSNTGDRLAGQRYLKPLAVSMGLVLTVTIVEVVAGFLSGSHA